MSPDNLPLRCEPTNDLFHSLSVLLGTCIPTSWAFTSTILGTLSICSWLFAQAPQVIKNYRNSSTSGLSIYFLIEWCMGDLSNFLGSIFTNQASWQVIIGAYYCIIDCCLISQWIWYERLHHGKKLRRMMRNKFKRDPDMASIFSFDFGQASGSIKSEFKTERHSLLRTEESLQDTRIKHTHTKYEYGSSPSSNTIKTSPNSRNIYRQNTRDNLLPIQTSKTFLLIAMLVALATTSPILPPKEVAPPPTSAKDIFGTVMSWSSAFLYLASRFPQILKNWRRRSTAGLSPLLFGAAFCGNLFYASSMLANPSLWHSYPPYGARGWIRESPSDRDEWALAALPFFIGAAGVLVMDATVGFQFWCFTRAESEEEEGVGEVYAVEGVGKKWKEVTGWMRGWKPSVS